MSVSFVMLLQTPAGAWTLLRQTGPTAKLLLLLLAGFSVLSWAILWDRRRAFRGAEQETDLFLGLFRSTPDLSQVRQRADGFRETPVAAIFRAGFEELGHTPRAGGAAGGAAAAMGLRNLDRGLQRAAREERARLERGLGFLATTASVTPFVGLLGTVWGIMNAFHGIGLSGNANLAAVAPGIAEALINTAAGLAAAIPAVLGYNHFVGRMRRMGIRMENFASEFAARADRLLSLPGQGGDRAASG